MNARMPSSALRDSMGERVRKGLKAGLAGIALTTILSAADSGRPGLFFREDFKETPPETPITQAHIANPDLILSLYGPGKDGVKKSHHDQPADDPYYVWTGTCSAPAVVTLRHRASFVDLTGLAKL